MKSTLKIEDNIKEKDMLTLFHSLFQQFFQPLVVYAYRHVNDWQVSEDIVQDVFMSLWIKKSEIDFDAPMRPYLYRATYNKSVNYLNTALAQFQVSLPESVDDLLTQEILSYNQHDMLLLKEISQEIDLAIETLPLQCRKVFRLSRDKNMKNKEIASLLHISEKAVEKHITKALNHIRQHLMKMDLLSLLLYLACRV